MARPATLSALSSHREVAPPSHIKWLGQRDDEYTKLQEAFNAWLASITEDEATFKKHVYDNEDLHEGDLRQHRQHIYFSLGLGEQLAMSFLVFGEKKDMDVSNFVNLIDQKLEELRKTLNEWHGTPDQQIGIPEDFKQAMREVDEGKIVDMDVG